MKEAAPILLIVEDKKEFREFIAAYLRQQSYEVHLARNGQQGLEAFVRVRPDLIVADTELPHLKGYEMCENIRRISTVPIMYLGSAPSEEALLDGLITEADEYVQKPFQPQQLAEKIQLHLQRIYPPADHIAVYDEIKLNFTKQTVFLHDVEIVPTETEKQLLFYLAERPGQFFSSAQLFEELWGKEALRDTRTVVVHVRTLRKKIEPDADRPKFLQYIVGSGYTFRLQPE